MPIERIPPHAFDALYRFYKSGHRPGECLMNMLSGRMYEAAKIADPEVRAYFPDIILFIHEHADNLPSNHELFDMRWEAWRIRYSKDATEIDFYRGPDE